MDRKQSFVKRVGGVPGDRIHIVDKVLVRNGAAVNEPYVVHRTPYVDDFRDNFPNNGSPAWNPLKRGRGDDCQ